MQKDETVGRVLLASLHQAIAEVLPARLEFYETWLKPSDLHQQTIGVSACLAVLSFLRREANVYDIVMARAGQYAAMWSFEEIGGLRRGFARALPHRMRARSASRLMRQMLRGLYPDTRVEIAWRGSTLFIDLQGSPFCTGPGAAHPVCGFYAGAIVAFFRLFNLDAAVRVSRCRASGARSCLLLVLIDAAHAVPGARTSSLGLASGPPEERIPEAAVQTVTAVTAAVTMSVEAESAVPEPPDARAPAPAQKVESPQAAPSPKAGAPAEAVTAEAHRAEPPQSAEPTQTSEPAPAGEPAPPSEPERVAEPIRLTEPARAAEPAPASASPRLDQAQIEAEWAQITTTGLARSEEEEEPGKASPAPSTGTERDPEAPWRRL